MMNTSLDLVPPIRCLESFSILMFYCSEGWMMVFLFRECEHNLFFWFGRRDVITIVSGDRVMISDRLR